MVVNANASKSAPQKKHPPQPVSIQSKSKSTHLKMGGLKSVEQTRSELAVVCTEECKSRLINCPEEKCSGKLRSEGVDKSGSIRMKCTICPKSCGPKKILQQLWTLQPSRFKDICEEAAMEELARMGVEPSRMEEILVGRGKAPLSPRARKMASMIATKEDEELEGILINVMREEGAIGESYQATEVTRGIPLTNKYQTLAEPMGGAHSTRDMMNAPARKISKYESISEKMDSFQKEIEAELQDQEEMEEGAYEMDAGQEQEENQMRTCVMVSRTEFDDLKIRMEGLCRLVNMLIERRAEESRPQEQTNSPRRQPSLADRIAEAERMRQQGLVVVKGRDGSIYGVRPEALEAKAERSKGNARPAIIYASGFKGLRYREVRGLMQSYGLNPIDVIAMSFMGQVLEIVVGGEASEHYRSVLRSKERLLENFDALDGSPLRLNVSPETLTEAEVRGVRREAVMQARTTRWNRIIAQIPSELTRKRALLARVRDGRLAERQELMREESQQESRGLTRLDQLVMAKLAAAVQAQTSRREATSSGDERVERPRKILNRKVTSEMGVTRAQ